jgi:glycosyltransferase involved in cell wall biosynthesis
VNQSTPNGRGSVTGGTRQRRADRTKVLYLAPGDVGKGRVEPILWMQTCSAYAEKGLDVELVSLRVRRPDAVSRAAVWRHYGLEPTFRLIEVPTSLDRNASTASSRMWAGLAALWFALGTAALQLARPRRVVVHARLPVLATPFLFIGRLLPRSRRPRVILETHALPRESHAWVLRNVDLVVTNSQKLTDEIVARFGVPFTRVLHSPLPPHNRITPQDRDDARSRLALPSRISIACYTGKLTEEHCEFLLRVARQFAGEDPPVRLLIVGGNPEIISWTRGRATQLGVSDSIILAGFVDPRLVADYLAAADVLVYHTPESGAIYPYCTPAKAFEYQAAERPIVATDLPLFEEVFGREGERAVRVVERTPEAMARGVVQVLSIDDRGAAMSKRAADWVRERTWERRTSAILEALDA